MKRLLFTTTLLLAHLLSFAQATVTLQGDVNDPSFMAKVEQMRAAGIDVKLNVPDPLEVKLVNKELPPFELKDIDGNTVTSNELIGKKIHINIWSTSCKPCIEEFPELNRLKEDYADKGYVFIGIALEPSKKIQKLLNKRPLNYLIIPNAEVYLKELGIHSFPVNLFIDAKGIVQRVIHGASYRMEIIDGKQKMIPDNYDDYKKALIDL